jgi:hypothetical protein
MTELTPTEKEVLRQKELTPEGIQADDFYIKILQTTNPEEMKTKVKGEIMAGWMNSKKNVMKVLVGDRMLDYVLHEFLHSVIFHSGIKTKFSLEEEEMFVRILTRGFRQYLNALNLQAERVRLKNG